MSADEARAIRFSTPDALCRELECQPGDLLESISREFEEPYAAELEEVDP